MVRGVERNDVQRREQISIVVGHSIGEGRPQDPAWFDVVECDGIRSGALAAAECLVEGDEGAHRRLEAVSNTSVATNPVQGRGPSTDVIVQLHQVALARILG